MKWKRRRSAASTRAIDRSAVFIVPIRWIPKRLMFSNYAEALFEAGERSGFTERFADLIDAVAGAIESDQRLRVVLESPRVQVSRRVWRHTSW